MSSVFERKHPSGRVSIRVLLRRKGYPSFSLSFDNWDSACDWVEENEEKYFQNPERYHKWRNQHDNISRRKKKNVFENIHRMKKRLKY